MFYGMCVHERKPGLGPVHFISPAFKQCGDLSGVAVGFEGWVVRSGPYQEATLFEVPLARGSDALRLPSVAAVVQHV